MNSPSDPAALLRAWPRLALALGLFALGYAIINLELMKHAILYRYAANDLASAGKAFAGIALQAVALLALVLTLPRRWFAAAMALVFTSALINVGYGLVVGDVLDPAKIAWILSERAQAGAAAGEFFGQALLTLAATLAAVGLLCGARRAARGVPGIAVGGKPVFAALTVFAVSVVAVDWAGLGPIAAERNAPVYLARLLSAEPAPPRGPVQEPPAGPPRVEKIVWLIDESVVYRAYAKLVAPELAPFGAVDFGEARSLGNCSAPSNVALRAGVPVDSISAQTDLRRTPSIWGYARKAGFRNTMIDGQSKGPTQNMLLPPERALIDRVEAFEQGLDTDRAIARELNQVLRAPGRDFVYVVLKGVHFQYRDHYPSGLIPDNSPVIDQYETAVRYTRVGFFDTLLAGVPRERVAVFYTSDHGQNVREGVLPHCSLQPDPLEFSVPLVAILPGETAATYRAAAPGGRSHGQIFPATLRLLGYDTETAHGYDNDLDRPTRRKLWFGRTVVPITTGDPIELHIDK